MIRHTTLLATPDLEVHRVEHPAGHLHRDPEEESSDTYAISFVERGSFSIRSRYGAGQLRPGDVLITRPGDVYSCRHAEPYPDDVCLSVTWRRRAIEEDRDSRQLVQASRPRMVIGPSNRLRYLRWRLDRLLSGPDTRVAAEGLALALWRALLDPSRRLYRERQVWWYAERVEAARELMHQRFADDLSLAALARAVGMSSHHFCRIFAELAGVPPHRYLLEVRLRVAADLLRQGASVTDACFRSGFQNLSHFIRLFHRRFGVTPSRLAASP